MSSNESAAEPAAKRAAKRKRTADILAPLAQDHRKIAALLKRRKSAEREQVLELVQRWLAHDSVEREVILPVLQRNKGSERELYLAAVKRDLITIIVHNLVDSPTDQLRTAMLAVFADLASDLMRAEEKPQTGLFALARSSPDAGSIPERLKSAHGEITRLAEDHQLTPPEPAVLRLAGFRPPKTKQESEMPRQSMRERDEEGRFASDDDDYRGRGGSRSSGRDRDEQGRFMSEDDDDRRGSRSGSRSQYRDRDEQGRFMSDDDYDDYRGRSGPRSSQYRERDERGQSMSDDDYRGGSRSRGRDDNGRRSAEYDDDDRRQGGGRGGWFGDSEGHSEASRRGWRNSDHEGSGWYGDPEGHSEASRRGRESSNRSRGRSAYDDDDRRSARGRSDYDDDDRRSSRGQGRGGWSGDPEGHSEAARRGWQNRR